jgi:hypothetical protein
MLWDWKATVGSACYPQTSNNRNVPCLARVSKISENLLKSNAMGLIIQLESRSVTSLPLYCTVLYWYSSSKLSFVTLKLVLHMSISLSGTGVGVTYH